MGTHNDKTAMGGERTLFHTTIWNEIIDSGTSDENRRKHIVNNLIVKYWKPVYCYLRRKGYDNESAKDLTQGFFQEVVLGRELIQRADQTKGRFRTFLLTALDRYAIDIHEKRTSRKRTPHGHLMHLGDIDIPDLTPEESFNYAWLAGLLDRVLSEVKEECSNAGLTTHWQIFVARLLDPVLHNTGSPALKDLCTKLNIENESRASGMITTVKRRLNRALMRCLKQLAKDDSEIREEINNMLMFFSKKGAG